MTRIQPRPRYREDPSAKTPGDGAIVRYWLERWESQTIALLPRDRQIDENVRMLLGSQWLVWNPLLQRHFDVSEWFRDAGARERQRPVFNRLLPWFVITHARMTENQPILTFLPGADAEDADLADAHDRLYKWTFRKMGMPDAIARVQAWKIVAGAAGMLFYVDPSKGDWQPILGPAIVPVVNPQTGEVLDQVQHPQVPLQTDRRSPAAVMLPDGQLQPMPGVQPGMQRRGRLCVEVLSPLEFRGEWGPKPWHEKSWHALERWMSPEDVWNRWKVEVAPGPEAATSTIAKRVLLGNGLYQAMQEPGLPTGHAPMAAKELARIRIFFEAPSLHADPFAETPDNPGGRYTVIANDDTVIYDGPRPLAYPYTSPVHVFDFLRLPGRPGGSSPQNNLNSPQRSYNRQKAYELQHTHMNAHPIAVIDRESGVKREQWTNEPGSAIVATRRANVPAVQFLEVPRLNDDVWRVDAGLKRELDELGMLLGTSGEPLSPDQSGEAIRELRFNADRYLGASLRGDVEELGRVAYTWMPFFRLLYDREETIRIVGEDDLPMTISVFPQMFDPETVNIVPDAESMLPESRQERQARALAWYREGLLGAPGSLEAKVKYWEIARFPHHARFTKPGGVDALTAERENAMLVRGTPADQIPVYPWYDDQVHVYAHEQEMKSVRFTRYDPMVRAQFVAHWMQHQQRLAALAQQQAAAMAAASGGGGGGGKSAASPLSQSASPPMPQPPSDTSGAYPTTPALATQ